jgi:RNA polymerase sigma-70 factor (ECF subfamily)
VTDSNVEYNGGLARTSVTLLMRVKAKDPGAWQRLVSLYGPLVFRWCRHAGLQDADAADVGQEVFRTLANSIGGFEHGRGGGSFRGWLWTVTRSRILEFLRRHKRAIQGSGGSDAQMRLLKLADGRLALDEPTDDDDKRQLVRRAVELVLENCKKENRQAFFRVVVEGHRAADVARDLGVTVNTVYVAKSYILRRLREELADLVEL